ncbi:hypothetical protein NUW58_g10286 [Xylaria curta]|uniref:Uncharacterized protein n=1 Tax=Xylaria curta TaxID=42375 RepID=A0ACC1MPF4_9PEZI|nr:hypothetical protein NUW58_g10286 [Xylaria curta]
MFKLVSRSRSLLEGKGVGRRAAAKAPVTHVSDEPLHGGPEFVSDKALLHTTSYNDSVTPVDTSRNADQYASRPLPDTPPHKGNMADRPNTSSGPGSKKTPKSDFNFDKRMSRDDLHIGSKTYGRTRREPYPPFRGQPPPTPDASPKAAPTQRLATVTSNWKSTPDLLREAGSENIGMALGSPTHPPPVFSQPWNSQNATPPGKDSHVVSPPESRSSSVDTFDMPVTRKPSARWKLFGIFGRKQSDPPVPAISISDPNGLYGTNRPEEVTPDLNSPSRSNTTSSRKGPKHKPIVVRSQTMPLGVQGDGKFGRIPIALDTGAEPSPASRPLLNVDIPDVRMERYSVMFNSVLNSNPSLLSRRQANVPKLKSIEDVPGREEVSDYYSPQGNRTNEE